MLWKTPAKTWDASEGGYFYMRAALITTVHDYLSYGYVVGQVCNGYCGCMRCMDDTMSQQLTSRKDGGSGQIVYMGHRRWLEQDDPWRNCGDLFNGHAEHRGPPRKRSGAEIDELLKDDEKGAGAAAEGMEDEVCFLGLGVLAQTRYTSLP